MSVGASGDHEPVPAEPETTRPEPTLPTYLPTYEAYAEPPVDATYTAPGTVPYPYPGYAGAAQYPPPYPDLGTAPSPANYPPPVYPPYPGYPPYGGYPATAEQTNTLAIVALVLSFFFWPAGLICGLVARRQISRTGQSGRGLATAAIVLGSLQFAFIALVILAGIAGT